MKHCPNVYTKTDYSNLSLEAVWSPNAEPLCKIIQKDDPHSSTIRELYIQNNMKEKKYLYQSSQLNNHKHIHEHAI